MDDSVLPVSPKHWFLDDRSMPRTPSYTSGNLVVPLIDGQEYMADLHQRILRMADTDFIYLAGWRVSPNQRLLEAHSGLPFVDQMKDLASRSVTVRFMVWCFPGSVLGMIMGMRHAGENIRFVKEVNSLRSDHAVAILDSRLPSGVIASHHQKAIVLRSGGIDWAYARTDRVAPTVVPNHNC